MSGLMRGIAAVATATVAFTFGGGVAFAGTAANIRVTDIRDVSAVVSWTGTAAEAAGAVAARNLREAQNV